jgi:hypothetical protein
MSEVLIIIFKNLINVNRRVRTARLISLQLFAFARSRRKRMSSRKRISTFERIY